MSAVVLLSCLSFNASAKKNHSDEVKVISYNIRVINKKDGPNEWKYRAAATPAMIKDYAPDIFGLQEAEPGHLEYLAKHLPKYSSVGVGREDGISKGEHMSIYYNTKTVELLEWGTYWLSETPDVPSKGWDAACKRTATWALLKMKDSGTLFPGSDSMENDAARAQFAAGRIGMKMAASWDVYVLNEQFPAECIQRDTCCLLRYGRSQRKG